MKGEISVLIEKLRQEVAKLDEAIKQKEGFQSVINVAVAVGRCNILCELIAETGLKDEAAVLIEKLENLRKSLPASTGSYCGGNCSCKKE